MSAPIAPGDWPGGCVTGNDYLAKGLGCHPSTVRDLLAIFKAHGLVDVIVRRGCGRDRFIHLFPLWRALAEACRRTWRLTMTSTRPPRPPFDASVVARTPRLICRDRVDGVTKRRHTPPSVVVPTPTASPEPDPQLVAAVEALNIPRATARRRRQTRRSGASSRARGAAVLPERQGAQSCGAAHRSPARRLETVRASLRPRPRRASGALRHDAEGVPEAGRATGERAHLTWNSSLKRSFLRDRRRRAPSGGIRLYIRFKTYL